MQMEVDIPNLLLRSLNWSYGGRQSGQFRTFLRAYSHPACSMLSQRRRSMRVNRGTTARVIVLSYLRFRGAYICVVGASRSVVR